MTCDFGGIDTRTFFLRSFSASVDSRTHGRAATFGSFRDREMTSELVRSWSCVSMNDVRSPAACTGASTERFTGSTWRIATAS